MRGEAKTSASSRKTSSSGAAKTGAGAQQDPQTSDEDEYSPPESFAELKNRKREFRELTQD